MSRWTNVRPRFRITWEMDSETLAAFAEGFALCESERALRAEARVRELEVAQGELLDIIGGGRWTRIDHLNMCGHCHEIARELAAVR